ncbi:hypothetical protein O181_028498 [Austropuccinia psidii MF-1]|uniref:Reverse transcriptase Ty1/copia-type domain-containing protein n=1 Tax=Austropuccinia psidii MF-1 TaxID=1389203 RepID=A0A9Q3H1W1_9BASI|nr:hypothetical protein [Austropuccinia psidii MF-1]
MEESLEIEELPLPVNSPISAMVGETHSDELNANSTEINNHPRIKVIGPRHPTLITSSIDQLNVLPYSRRGNALFSASIEIPSTYKNALKSKDKDLWKQAINKELDNMNQLKVWEIVDLKDDYKLVGTTWIFRIKTNHQNEAVEFKARLCAQGFSQTQGSDYNKTAFLNAELSEVVYLAIPQGINADQRQKCPCLNKAIYSLKQAPLAWYTRLKQWLLKIGFRVSILDPCVFFKHREIPTWIYIHVDDIVIFSKDVSAFKNKIGSEFDIKDIGPADLILGIKVTQSEEKITLDQRHFSESLLNLYGMSECKEATTPLVPNKHLGPATSNEITTFNRLGINFRSAIGSLNYLSTATRPDLAHAVSALSQYLENPGIRHWKGFLHVLRYLKGSQELGLHYHRNGKQGIIAYSDADWGNCRVTRRSISGYLALFEGCLVLWKTRKQQAVSTSTAEAEYKALCDLTSEMLWLRQWAIEIGIVEPNCRVLIWNDNQSCINTPNGDSSFNNNRMKHVDIQLHFVREVVQSRDFQLQYVRSENMLADFLTKSVSKPVLERALNVLSVSRLKVRGDVGELAERS